MMTSLVGVSAPIKMMQPLDFSVKVYGGAVRAVSDAHWGPEEVRSRLRKYREATHVRPGHLTDVKKLIIPSNDDPIPLLRIPFPRQLRSEQSPRKGGERRRDVVILELVHLPAA